MACLRQLSQREAKEVCENASAAAEELNKRRQSSYAVVMGDKGLEGIDFKVWSRARIAHVVLFYHLLLYREEKWSRHVAW